MVKTKTQKDDLQSINEEQEKIKTNDETENKEKAEG